MAAITLSFVDYLVFVLFILVSFAIGIFYAYRSRKSTSEEEYFVGKRKIHVFAAACSAMASAFTGSSLIAFPNDAYFRGTGIWFGVLMANLIEAVVLPLVFVPVYHRLKLTNVYDYLGLRFNDWVKYYAVSVQVLFTMFYMGVQVYAPSLAMSVVSGISINLSIFIVGGTCVVYTAIGGMKAVVWNDVFQTFILFLGTIVLFAIGIPAVGGIGNMMAVARENGRQVTVDMTFDLTRPYTFWSMIFALPLYALTRSAVGQYNAQRYLVVKSVREARLTAIFGQLFSASFLLAYVFAGLLLAAYFAGCDPYTNGEVDKRDQVFPLFLLEQFHVYPGIIGLLISAVFSSSLSTVSSGINAQTVMTHNEIGQLLLKDASPAKNILFNKLLSAFLGCCILGIAFLGTHIGGIIDAIITWSGILIGPILAVFSLGMLSRRANSIGAFSGMICSTIVGIWLKIGNTFYPGAPSSVPPLFVDECNNYTESFAVTEKTYMVSMTTNGEDPDVAHEIPSSVYQLSTVYYSLLSFIVTWTVALVVSMVTGVQDSDTMNEDLFILPKMISFHSSEKTSEYVGVSPTDVVTEMETVENSLRDT